MARQGIDPLVVLLFLAAVIAAVAALYYLAETGPALTTDVYRHIPVSPDGTSVKDIEYRP